MKGTGTGISIGSATPMVYWGKSVFCMTAQQREVDVEWEILVSICGVCVYVCVSSCDHGHCIQQRH